MEPNGGSFVSILPSSLVSTDKLQINKIRQIASTLLETPESRKGPLALKSQEYLSRFLDVLMKLERVSPGGGASGNEVDAEEEELRHWADLREYQLRFLQSGGFFNDI